MLSNGEANMYREEAIAQINQQLDKIFSEKSRVVVLGITDYTRALFEETNLFDYKIEAVVDADEKKCGQRFFCMNIKNPDDIDFCKIDLVIVGAVGHKRDIQTYLAENDFGSTQVVELEPTGFHKMYRNYDDKKIHYLGDYQSWEEAESQCTGYDDEEILNKVKEATMSVINGNAIYERDSVLFYSKNMHIRFVRHY